jgi:hypothetical protein
VPGVGIERVRTGITRDQALSLLRLQLWTEACVRWYGSCPPHDATTGRLHRLIPVNVAIGRYTRDRCHSHGNQLELRAAATQRPVHRAAVDPCHRLGCDVAWIRRW